MTYTPPKICTYCDNPESFCTCPMTREEIIGRLESLSELRNPAALGLEADRAWRVACREAAKIMRRDGAARGD